MSNSNGYAKRADGTVTDVLLDTVALEYNRVTDVLNIGGVCNSLELMIDMLNRAVRNTEAALRKQQAVALQEELRQMAAEAALRKQLGGR